MKKALLIDSTRRGFIRATERGLDVLKKDPKRIDVNFLDQFLEFVEFRTPRREDASIPVSHSVELLDPKRPLRMRTNGCASVSSPNCFTG